MPHELGGGIWEEHDRPIIGPGLPINPPPPDVPPVDPAPWIDPVIPPEEERRPPPPPPPVVVIEPVVQPPMILPPPPDITPVTIVPPEFEDPIPEPLPVPPNGTVPMIQPPASIVPLASIKGIGTFMVYRGTKLVLSMAASETGQQLIEEGTAMLVGAVLKRLAPGTSIRFHTGRSPGDPISFGSRGGSAVSYMEAWRMTPQEFSYWEK